MKGTPNKQTVQMAELARRLTDKALGVYIETIDATMTVLEPVQGGEPGETEVVVVYRYPNDCRQRAADTILAYGWGRPTQSHMLSGPNGGPVQVLHLHDYGKLVELPTDELMKLYRASLAAFLAPQPAQPQLIEHDADADEHEPA